MASPGMKPRTPFPTEYKGFRLHWHGGRVYGLPGFLDAEELIHRNLFTTHPSVLSALNFDELITLIDASDLSAFQQESVGSYQGFHLLRYRGHVYGVPESAGAVDLNCAEDRNRPGVVRGATIEEARQRIDQARSSTTIEHAGWLPVFRIWGNCGRHPQFTHVNTPPEGYHFTSSAPPQRYAPTRWGKIRAAIRRKLSLMMLSLWLLVRPFLGFFGRGASVGPKARFTALGSLFGLFCRLVGAGARPWHVLQFLRSRNYESQVLISRKSGLVFYTSMPYTYGQNPWLIEIEDPVTLLYPHVQNGYTCNLDLSRVPYLPMVRKLLESQQCRGVITHMKSTARMLSTLFESSTIQSKVFHVPLGVGLPEQYQRHDESEHVELLFTSSWSQIVSTFFLRGGLDVLEAFATLRERYPQIRLTIRADLPELDPYFHRILEEGWVRVIPRFLTRPEMDQLLAESHILLLPAARVHIVSLLQGMAAGLAVVASDGWGFEEYVDHERNGLIVPGRYGKVSWVDEEAGMLREDYGPMHTVNPDVVEGLVQAVSRLIEDRLFRQQIGQNARHDVETKYSLENWNRGLGHALDTITGVEPDRRLPTPEDILIRQPAETC